MPSLVGLLWSIRANSRHIDGTVKGQFAVTADMIAGKGPARQVTFDLMWDARVKRWVLYLVGGAPVEGYLTMVRNLWATLTPQP